MIVKRLRNEITAREKHLMLELSIKKFNKNRKKVKGKGNFKGTLSIPFAITSQDISNLTLTASNKEYKNRANIFVTNIMVADTNGKALSAGKDYDKSSIVYTYANAVKLENGVSKKAGAVVKKQISFLPILEFKYP